MTSETFELDGRPEGEEPSRAPVGRLALIGNALPRKCGLATFTSHVSDALAGRYPDLVVDHYAMDDGTGVEYPEAIRLIGADDRPAYRAAAKRMAEEGAEAILLQHEYGIFGGEAGRYILDLLDESDLPVITVLHTVLERPAPAEREVLATIIRRSTHLVVMAKTGADILTRWHGVPPNRISVIPHGVPDRKLVDPATLKPRFGWEGRKVVMTFGLLSHDKGVQHMIEALPALVERHPDMLYVVVGATHPNLVRHEGETYRQSLIDRTKELGVADHVEFIDAFVEQDELLDRLQASDVYVTPYLNMNQVTSGTLAYAVAVGKPVVSTPYVHASELLAGRVGSLVEPANPEALASAIDALLSDHDARRAMAKRAYRAGRKMLWPRGMERTLAPLSERAAPAQVAEAPRVALPTELSFAAVEAMSDGVGMLQHSRFGIADRNHGYCIDDNCRAMMVALKRYRRTGEPEVLAMARRYAAFIGHAWHPAERAFRNFMAYDRTWCEDRGSDDSNGRTLWTLMVAIVESPDEEFRGWARAVLSDALDAGPPLRSPRSQCFAAIGAFDWLSYDRAHLVALKLLEQAGDTLCTILSAHRRDGWDWFEARLSYDNARMPEALLKAGMALGRDEWIGRGLETLEWLSERQHRRGIFRAVGSRSFFNEYREPRQFDQQPLEAAASIDAALVAHRITGAKVWRDRADEAYAWFFGDNDHGLPLATLATGGCFDGLTEDGVNRNQGAESILALHQAAEAMARAENGENAVSGGLHSAVEAPEAAV
ncbi:glycosyltransferase family 4 protein [Sphingomonas sp. ASV193]|uniref:glycosyltransferase family 4 protein n=1 Tax=Sphingomonas sp. ASV193 TaxID=3144405 RepID=UPI0032E8A5E0